VAAPPPGPAGVVPAPETIVEVTRPPPPPDESPEVTVARLRPKFRACYQQGLRSDPTLAGRTHIKVRLDAEGNVLMASAEQVTGLTPDVVKCLSSVLVETRFSAPADGSATLVVPIAFQQQASPGAGPPPQPP
jgi:hypothetical protein